MGSAEITQLCKITGIVSHVYPYLPLFSEENEFACRSRKKSYHRSLLPSSFAFPCLQKIDAQKFLNDTNQKKETTEKWRTNKIRFLSPFGVVQRV